MLPVGSSPRVRGKRETALDKALTLRIIPARAGQTSPRCSALRAGPDHPRACGANDDGGSQSNRVLGSSPRVRGKRLRDLVTETAPRIIPARAGQTLGSALSMVGLPDHPRACGANDLTQGVTPVRAGSSPRVRGKLFRWRRMCQRQRIIPARAGQTQPARRNTSHRPDHPRACGANATAVDNCVPGNGSSPRVRGKLPVGDAGDLRDRIIPARAGQTPSASPARPSSPDHPRACGANLGVAAIKMAADGSSPRVRGKRGRSCEHAVRTRIIPARAGQTTVSQNPIRESTDHPRACGANVSVFLDRRGVGGSSPRVRGKRHPPAPEKKPMRIIPARAGQTGTRPESPRTATDHPRACGANSARSPASSAICGSSPRVRGKPSWQQNGDYHPRIIPARAGQTCIVAPAHGHHPDHPRACGANQYTNRTSPSLNGSSPRVRGKRFRRRTRSAMRRIIPARAGQT